MTDIKPAHGLSASIDELGEKYCYPGEKKEGCSTHK